METPVEPKNVNTHHSFTLMKEKLPDLLKLGTVTALTCGGIGLMVGGGLAWSMNENAMFFGCFLAGAIFIATGGMGFLKCLDGKQKSVKS